MSDITNPHDKFFRQVWSHKQIVEDFLANYLPDELHRHLQLDSLELENRSYIDENLRDQYSDMLYSVKLQDNSPAFLYMLFEHKSYPDHHVAVQLLRYMGEIWHQYLKGQSTSEAKLPLIIPLIFYHGAGDWQPRKLGELVEAVPDSFTPYIPDFSFAFSNFATSASPDFRGEALLRAILRLLHTMPGGDLRRELNQIMLLLKGIVDDPTGKSIFHTMIEYIYAAQDEVTPEEMGRTARSELSSKEEEEIMTIAEQLEKRGECTVLQHLLENRFGKLSGHYRKRLEQADNETLLKWSERVLTAQSIEEVFAEE